MRAKDASIGLALVFMVLLFTGLLSVGTEQVAAQSQPGTGIDASVTGTGFFERRIEYGWSIQKTTGQTQVDIWAGNCSTIDYTLNATRTLASQTDRYGVRGQVCVTNSGAISTQNLTINCKVQFKTGSGPFQDLPGATVTILPSQLNGGQQNCYPYEIAYTPI